MQCPQRRAEPGARHVQCEQQAPEQDRAQRVAGERDDMVAEGLQSPERVLQPEIRQDEREIIRGRGRPDLLQAELPDNRGIRRDVHLIVPKKLPDERALINKHQQQRQHGAGQPATHRRGMRCGEGIHVRSARDGLRRNGSSFGWSWLGGTVQIDLGHRGVEPARFRVVHLGLGHPARKPVGQHEVQVCRRRVGVEPHRLFKLRDRLARPAEIAQGDAVVIVRGSVAGVEPQRLAMVRERLRRAASLAQRAGEVVVIHGIAGLKLDRRLKVRKRLDEAALFAKDDGQST